MQLAVGIGVLVSSLRASAAGSAEMAIPLGKALTGNCYQHCTQESEPSKNQPCMGYRRKFILYQDGVHYGGVKVLLNLSLDNIWVHLLLVIIGKQM